MRGVLGLMSALRWTLLILGVLFIAVLAWWERRRPRQASGAVERTAAREPLTDAPPRALREPSLTLPEMRAREPLVPRELAVVELTSEPVTRAGARACRGGRGGGGRGRRARRCCRRRRGRAADTARSACAHGRGAGAAAREPSGAAAGSAAAGGVAAGPGAAHPRAAPGGTAAGALCRALAAPGAGGGGLRARPVRDLSQARRGAPCGAECGEPHAPGHFRLRHHGLAALRRPVAVRGAAGPEIPAAGFRGAGVHRAQPQRAPARGVAG